MNKYLAFQLELQAATQAKTLLTFHSERDNTAELAVKGNINLLLSYGISVDSFAREMNAWLHATSAGNNARLSMHYEVVHHIVTKKAEVWHKKINGDRDRLVATISKK